MGAPQPSLNDLRIARDARPATGASWGRRGLFGVGLLVVGVALIVWWLRRPAPLTLTLEVAREASSGSGDRTLLNASGYVTARREATLSSKITGRVTEVLIEEGQTVIAGQVIARLDGTNVRANLLLARAQLEAAVSAQEESRVRIREAELDLQRQTNLLTAKVSPQSDFDRAEASMLAWKARLAQQQSERVVAERNVAIWEQQLDDTVIQAPFAGVVTSKNAQPGEMISPMSSGGFTRTGICTIVDMESLEIEIDVNESYINRVKPGQPVEAALDAYSEWKMPCNVIAIIPTADRQKSTVRVRVGFNQLDPRILPQMGVKVAFREVAGTPASPPVGRGVIVSSRAVRQVEGRDVVFVIHQGRAERRAVTLSERRTQDVILSAGLNAGESVAVDAPSDLVDGTVVIPRKP